MAEAKSPYELVSQILKESGVKVTQLRQGDYNRMIQAVGDGDFDFGISIGKDGLANVTVEGAPTPQPDSKKCPAWMPMTLCAGYGAIVNSDVYSVVSDPGSWGDKISESVSEPFVEYGTRVALFLLGVVLVTIALVFTFKGEAISAVTGVAKDVLK